MRSRRRLVNMRRRKVSSEEGRGTGGTGRRRDGERKTRSNSVASIFQGAACYSKLVEHLSCRQVARPSSVPQITPEIA